MGILAGLVWSNRLTWCLFGLVARRHLADEIMLAHAAKQCPKRSPQVSRLRHWLASTIWAVLFSLPLHFRRYMSLDAPYSEVIQRSLHEHQVQSYAIRYFDSRTLESQTKSSPTAMQGAAGSTFLRAARRSPLGNRFLSIRKFAALVLHVWRTAIVNYRSDTNHLFLFKWRYVRFSFERRQIATAQSGAVSGRKRRFPSIQWIILKLLRPATAAVKLAGLFLSRDNICVMVTIAQLCCTLKTYNTSS
jgi:hypothetical protein